MNVSRRRYMGSKGGSILPAGYTQVEYIENTSTAYIDTGVPATSDIELTLDVYVVNENANTYVIGCSNVPGTTSPAFEFYNSYNTMREKYNTTYTWLEGIKIGNKRCFISIHGNCTEVDNGTSTKTFYVQEETFTTNGNILFLISSFLRNITDSLRCKGKIYGATIGNVRNFVPCISPDNVVGLYDTIGNQFYSSPNGVEFVAGEPV